MFPVPVALPIFDIVKKQPKKKAKKANKTKTSKASKASKVKVIAKGKTIPAKKIAEGKVAASSFEYSNKKGHYFEAESLGRFYKIVLNKKKKTVTSTYGKIGTDGRDNVTAFTKSTDDEGVMKDCLQKAKNILKKGYAEKSQ